MIMRLNVSMISFYVNRHDALLSLFNCSVELINARCKFIAIYLSFCVGTIFESKVEQGAPDACSKEADVKVKG